MLDEASYIEGADDYLKLPQVSNYNPCYSCL